MDKIQIPDINIAEPLLSFSKDGKESCFDYKDGKWQFWGDLEIDESAKLLFESFGNLIEIAIKKKTLDNNPPQ
jgi:hypothetical protein